MTKLKSISYFADQCFSYDLTPIFNDEKECIGQLDLSQIDQSTLSIVDFDGQLICEGTFSTQSNKWFISSPLEVIGELRQKLHFFKPNFEYLSYTEGSIEIIHNVKNEEFEMYLQKTLVAKFRKNKHFFRQPAFELINYCHPLLTNEELIIVAISTYCSNFDTSKKQPIT